MKKLFILLLLLFVSLTSFSQRAAEFKNGITIQKEEVLASKFVSYGESYINNWRDLVLDDGATYFPNNGGYEIGRLHQAEINPSLHFIPAAVGEGVIYAIGKNRVNDLDVDRAAFATYIDEDRILRTAAFDVARIDYTDGDGAFLFEDESINKIERSETTGHSYWTKSGATIEGDASTAGADLLSGWDFTSGWSAITATIDDVNSFTSTGSNGYIYKNDIVLEYDKTYRLVYNFSSIPNAVRVRVGITGSVQTIKDITSEGVGELYFYVNSTTTNLFFNLFTAVAQTIDVTTLELYEVQGFSAPDGSTNAYKLVEDGTNSQHSITPSSAPSTIYTMSVYAKGSERIIQLASTTTSGHYANFDLSDGTIGNSGGTTENVTITQIVDGWYRCSMTTTSNMNTMIIALVESKTSSYHQTYTGDGTSGVYIFGAQVEDQSYATSYIKSDSGSSTTRLADVITGAGDVNTFSSVNESGVFYVEMARHTDATITNDYNPIGLVNGTDFVFMRYNPNGGLSCFIHVNNVEKLAFSTSIASTDFNKIAIRWSSTDATVYINGVQRTTVSIDASFPASTFDDLSFYQGGDNFYGKVKDLKVLPYLTDEEMILLTKMFGFMFLCRIRRKETEYKIAA